MANALVLETVETPLGSLILVADEGGSLRAAEFADCEARIRRQLDRWLAACRPAAGAAPAGIKAALAAYFSGELPAVRRIPVTTAGTPFQEAVWRALRTIEPGRPTTYSALARRIGKPAAVRAVGHANGANPVSIVIPCHRLVGADGTLTGYGGGIARKRWLLDHEARHAVFDEAGAP